MMENYDAVFCEDNQFNTKKARNYTRFLLGTYSRKVSLNSGLTRDNPNIKFADFIASAHRKLTYDGLCNYQYYCGCPPTIPTQLLKRVFEK